MQNSRSRPVGSRRWLFFIILHSAFCLGAWGHYSIDWYKIAGGGGTGTNGRYAVSGTVGQPAAGTMASGDYSLIGGFWGVVAAVQNPGAPALFIARSGSTVTVFWAALSGWTLQQNSSVASPVTWSASSGVTNANGTNYLFLPNPSGNLFFRLHQP